MADKNNNTNQEDKPQIYDLTLYIIDIHIYI